ncbi:hypothetical protein, partial [Prosthecobacter sp.]|uniref:hypothetical protein n=1 Tax=Prosthecobacter sp. TaxID=1965333 RepID=UPI0037C60118
SYDGTEMRRSKQDSKQTQMKTKIVRSLLCISLVSSSIDGQAASVMRSNSQPSPASKSQVAKARAGQIKQDAPEYVILTFVAVVVARFFTLSGNALTAFDAANMPYELSPLPAYTASDLNH